MPNPDFTGDVPHRRCETCKYWWRFRGVAGHCKHPDHIHKGGPPDAPVTISGWLTTTDLTVCSNWGVKEE